MRKRLIKLRAEQVRPGQVVVDLAHGRIRKRAGRWPTVTAAIYREDGADGQPRVDIELSDQPGAVFCLHPGEIVTIAPELGRTIRADQIKPGDIVMTLIGGGVVRKVDGRWPTVLSVSIAGTPPTVHIETSDRPGRVHLLARSEAVVVEVQGW